jgi:hypothetical protein
MMNDPKAYKDFATGWLDMKTPEFQKALHEFDAIGAELAKAATAQFARAQSFGFWSKPEGKVLAEKASDLTLETSAIGSLMDGLPTLNDKKGGWDPEIWGGLSHAYATAVIPEIVKGKKINVCVGAEVPPGNIWESVESVALSHGLEQAGISLEHVAKYYAAAAKSKKDRATLELTKVTNGIQGCLFVGDRPGAIAAADAWFKELDEISKYADGEPPAGWEAKVATKTPSEGVMPDDPGHTYHLLEDGTAVVTTKAKKLAAGPTKIVESKLKDEGWQQIQSLWAERPLVKAGDIKKKLSARASSTVGEWLKSWLAEGKLYRHYSGNTTDSGGLYAMDATWASAEREVNLDNRARFGYGTPDHGSAAGMVILSKGINAKHSLSPPQPTSFAWHQKSARYNSKRQPSTKWTGDNVFKESEAHLGHIEPPGCAGHFNNEGGYRLGKAGNRSWTNDPAQYWGPEHEDESSGSGGKAERYDLRKLAEPDCHPDFLKK